MNQDVQNGNSDTLDLSLADIDHSGTIELSNSSLGGTGLLDLTRCSPSSEVTNDNPPLRAALPPSAAALDPTRTDDMVGLEIADQDLEDKEADRNDSSGMSLLDLTRG